MKCIIFFKGSKKGGMKHRYETLHSLLVPHSMTQKQLEHMWIFLVQEWQQLAKNTYISIREHNLLFVMHLMNTFKHFYLLLHSEVRPSAVSAMLNAQPSSSSNWKSRSSTSESELEDCPTSQILVCFLFVSAPTLQCLSAPATKMWFWESYAREGPCFWGHILDTHAFKFFTV